MRSRPCGVLLVMVVVMGAAVVAGAQERPGAVYAGASVTVPWAQGLAEDSSQTYVQAPGGWSVGWTAGGGVFVLPKASVEFEVLRTGTMESTQPSRYFMTFHEQRRDTFFTAALRLHTRPAAAVDLEPVIGFDIVRGESWHCTDYWDHVNQRAIPCSTPEHDSADAVAGFSAGMDVTIGGRRVAAVGSFRVHRTFRGEAGTGWYPNGVAEWTIRLGAGIRLVF